MHTCRYTQCGVCALSSLPVVLTDSRLSLHICLFLSPSNPPETPEKGMREVQSPALPVLRGLLGHSAGAAIGIVPESPPLSFLVHRLLLCVNLCLLTLSGFISASPPVRLPPCFLHSSSSFLCSPHLPYLPFISSPTAPFFFSPHLDLLLHLHLPSFAFFNTFSLLLSLPRFVSDLIVRSSVRRYKRKMEQIEKVQEVPRG